MSAQIVPPLVANEREESRLRDAAEQLILVDEGDREIGVGAKIDVHHTGQLHRAFSILVFNARDELLLQRRANIKYHFAQRWSNTCCGHPRPGEATLDAAGRRLMEEFGMSVPLIERSQLIYRAEDRASGLIEHEYLHVFFGLDRERPRPDPTEIGAWRWMSIPVIQRALRQRPDWFTPWFALLVERLFPN